MTDDELDKLEKQVRLLLEKNKEEMRLLNRKMLIMGITCLVLILSVTVSLVLSFCYPAWKYQLNIFDGFVSLALSVLTFYVFITTDKSRRWTFIPLLLLGFTVFHIYSALTNWGIFR